MTVPTLLRGGESIPLPSFHSQGNLTGSHRTALVDGKDSLFEPVVEGTEGTVKVRLWVGRGRAKIGTD